jgi:hypothetical protein
MREGRVHTSLHNVLNLNRGSPHFCNCWVDLAATDAIANVPPPVERVFILWTPSNYVLVQYYRVYDNIHLPEPSCNVCISTLPTLEEDKVEGEIEVPNKPVDERRQTSSCSCNAIPATHKEVDVSVAWQRVQGLMEATPLFC